MSDAANPYAPPDASLGSSSSLATLEEGYTPKMVEHLRRTRPWLRLFAVLGFVLSSVNLLAAVLLGIDSQFLVAAAYVFATVVTFVPALRLSASARRIRALENGGGPSELEGVLFEQLRFWRLVGILSLVAVAGQRAE